ncbi:MAG: homoserine dehydrogenase [Alphaproteobacteria bacterium GM7ARS4]|nr:homoserine dehydrogenase [Alphaproteobacteria bacterium GM7ARS4]
MPPLRVAIAGLGTVGCGVVALLQKNHGLIQARIGRALTLCGVSSATKNKKRPVPVDAIPWYDDPCRMVDDSACDIVVELIGGADGIALHLATHALNKGCGVVTANKALLAHHGNTLMALASKNKVALAFEAAVAGGIPIIKTLTESMAGNHIARITAILNGTCNYILSSMTSQKRSFEDVLQEAQALGYAEADPRFDIDGIDAAHKLAILSSLAWGTNIALEQLSIQGIGSVTPEDISLSSDMGYTIKHLARAYPTKDNVIHQSVCLCLVPKVSALASVDGVFNAVVLTSDFCGTLTLVGQGAGGDATASSVVSDMIAIARTTPPPAHTGYSQIITPVSPTPDLDTQAYYLHLKAKDSPGVLADIASILGKEHISIESALQKAAEDHRLQSSCPVDLLITTHRSPSHAISKALRHLETLPTILAPPRFFPIHSEASTI